MKILSFLFALLISATALKSQSFTKEELFVFSVLSDMRYIDLQLSEKKFRLYETEKSTDGLQNALTYKTDKGEDLTVYINAPQVGDNRKCLLYSTISENWYTAFKKGIKTDTLYHFVSEKFVDGIFKTTYTNYVADFTFYVAGAANKQSNWNCVFIQPVTVKK